MAALHETENGIPPGPPPSRRVTGVLIAVVATIVVLLGLLSWRANSRVNKVALSSRPKPVTVVEAKAATYRPSREYIGTLEPWIAAPIGPQLVSAYVETVLVRPGASVKRGQVLATLDCRDTTAASKAVAMQARAVAEEQRASADEARRTQNLLDGGFISTNEVERKAAQSSSQAAQLAATMARLTGSELQVNDCILRAPFDGEIASREVDPGSFAQPGKPLLTIVDRRTIRFTADVPESDFEVVAPNTPVRLSVLATGSPLTASISRRGPGADPGTRTVHFEADVPNSDLTIPAGTTARAEIDVGQPIPAIEVPLLGASVRGARATLFIVSGEVARKKTLKVQGEKGGSLFLEGEGDLPPGTRIVVEGQALLNDGDPVAAGTAAGPASSRGTGPVVPGEVGR